METATVAEIKRELKTLSQAELINCCLRLARYKKENKELLHYLIFEAHDEASYVEGLKREIAASFSAVNVSSVYYAKKSIRKILRFTVKHIRYSGLKTTEVELLVCFCQHMRKLPLPFHQSKVLMNLYNRQIEKIHKSLATLDEDLQFDYMKEITELEKPIQK